MRFTGSQGHSDFVLTEGVLVKVSGVVGTSVRLVSWGRAVAAVHGEPKTAPAPGPESRGDLESGYDPGINFEPVLHDQPTHTSRYLG